MFNLLHFSLSAFKKDWQISNQLYRQLYRLVQLFFSAYLLVFLSFKNICNPTVPVTVPITVPATDRTKKTVSYKIGRRLRQQPIFEPYLQNTGNSSLKKTWVE